MANEDEPSKRQIFVRNFKPLTFYIIPCKRKRELTDLVVQHGGKMSKDRLSAQYQLYVPGDIVSNPKMVSSMFIEDSIQAECLLDVEKYRYAVREKVEKKMLENEEHASDIMFSFKEEPVSPKCSARPTVRTRLKEYTVEEDMDIIEAVLKHSKHHSINGTRLWDSLVAQKVTKRTSMSMKERFMKKILPFVENYNLSAVELKKLKSLSSAKTNQVRSKVGCSHRKASLPFLQAPKPLLKAPNPYAESSSSDDSLGSLVAPHTRIARKRKPILVELSSNSSQSSGSQQRQDEEARQKKDRLQVQSPQEKRVSKSDQKRSPRSATVPQTSRSRSDSVASYVIEETPPDVELPSSLTKMNELTQSDDLDLLVPPIKLMKRGPRANNARSTGKSTANIDYKLAASPIVLLTDSSDCASVLSPGLTSINSSHNSPVKRFAKESTGSPKTPSVGRSPVALSKLSTESPRTSRVDRLEVIPSKRNIRQPTASPKTTSARSNTTPDKESNGGQKKLTCYPETQPFTVDEIAAGTQQFSVTGGMEECVPIPGRRPPEESQNNVDALVAQSPLLFVEQSPMIVNDLPVEGPERILASSGSSLESLSEFLRPMTQLNDDCGVPGQQQTSDSIPAMGEGRLASSILSGPTDASTQKPSNEGEVDDPPLTWSTFDFASAGSARNDGETAIGKLDDIRTSSPNLPVNKLTNSLDEFFPSEAPAPAGGDELINQSWTDDERMTPEPTRPTSPPPLLRSNRLKKVLSQPLKQPQYEDANETFTSSQGSLYVSCLSADAPPGNQSKQTESKSSVKVEVHPSSKKPIPPPSGARQEEPVATTSRHQDSDQRVNLFINKCAECVKNPRKVCHVNELKSHAMYSKLMFTFGVEDKILLAFVLALSADWELIEQHFKSDGKVGVMWTQKDDRLLTNPSFRKRNLKELRKKFSAREIKARKQFLLEHVQLTPKQRQLLMGMTQ